MGHGKFVFFGTSDICLPFLKMLRDRFDLKLIITQPDTFGGRNRKKRIIPPVKTFALENNIPLEQPEILKDERLTDKIRALEPVLGVVVNGEARAYSMWHLDAHEIVNDVLGGVPIAATW